MSGKEIGEAASTAVVDAIDAVMSIPGAVKAIMRLVTSAGDAGAAWIDIARAMGEQKAQAVRDHTAAATVVSQALAGAAANNAISDTRIVERATAALIGSGIRKQENKEAVARLAVERLKEEMPPNDTAGPSDDWMNRFERLAEDASSDEVRMLYARALAGEIRRPGAVSLATLQFMSTIDSETANLIDKLVPYAGDKGAIFTKPAIQDGITFAQFIFAEQCGFGTFGQNELSLKKETEDDNNIWMYVGTNAIVMQFDERNTIHIGAFSLSRIGWQLVLMLGIRPNQERLARYLLEEYRPRSVTYGEMQLLKGDEYVVANPITMRRQPEADS